MKKEMVFHSIAKRLVRNGRTCVRQGAHCSSLTGVLRLFVLLFLQIMGNIKSTSAWRENDSQRGNRLFPAWETNVPSVGINNSPKGYFLRGLMLQLLMLTLGVNVMWGETDYSGIYYIANGKQLESPLKYYDKNNPSVNFYLCPAQYYYNPDGSGTDVVSETNNTGKPFLTTNRTNQGDNSIWLIEKVENKSTYYIKYIGVGDNHDKYLIKNPSLMSNFSSGVDDTRLRVHLEEKAKSELDNDAEFEIIRYGEGDNIYYGIRISTITNGWLNPSKGNKEAYVPSGNAYIGGIIGYYKDKMPDETGGEGSKWFLEKVPPVISYNSSNLIEISYIDASYTIYYSYGEESTPSPSSEGTFNYSETGPFDPPSGTTTIKAIAIKGEKESSVATFTPTFLLGSTHKYLIQAQGNGWTTGNFQGNHYYMIPGDKVGEEHNKITKVNTTSMLRSSMQWYLLNAGDNYYYIVNNVDNTRMRYNATNYVHMDTWDGDNANEFKFQIKSSTAGTYNIIPYGVTVDSKYLNKASGNAGDGALGLHNSATDANSRWKFVQQDTPLADTPPFTPSGESTSYYKIQNGNGTTFYITPPASANGNATASNATDDATVKSMSWYFIRVEDPTTTDWLAYYKIINAGTGKALYYAYTANNSPCLKVGDYDGSNDDYKFAFVKSTTADYYYIVPKSHKDDQLNKISTFYRDGTNIKPATTRAATGNVWTFTTADLFCNDPEFVEEDGKIKIKCNTNAAKIYINTESNADPTSESTLYNPSANENQNWATTEQVGIKAIAIVSDGTTPTSSNVVTLLNKPDITLSQNTYTYDGTAKEPGVTVSITSGENTVTAPTSPAATYTVTYSNNTDAKTETKIPTVTVTDASDTDNWYIWNTSETHFTINPKAVTITANNASKTYNGSALTESGFAASELETGDTHSFTVAMTAESTITDVGTQPNVIATVDEIAVTTGTETRVGNYLVTTAGGTLTINPKAVTITANNASKTYNGSALTESGFDASDLETGDTHTFTVTMTEGSTITNVGTQPNVIATVDGTDVTTGTSPTPVGNYLVTTANGTLKVAAKKVTITANDASKAYNGSALTNDEFTATALEGGDTHTFTVVMTEGSTITNAGTQPNVIATVDGVAITTGTETAVGNYLVTTANGTLTINPKAVTITAKDASQTYNGSALTESGFTASDLETGDEHTFTVVMTEGSTITNAGTQPNVIATVDGTAVTTGTETAVGNYLVTTANGTLTIEKASLTEVTLSATLAEHTGSAQIVTISSVNAGTLIVPETDYTVSYKISGHDVTELIDAGTYTVIVTAKENTNYTGSAETTFTISGIRIEADFTWIVDDQNNESTTEAAALFNNTTGENVTIPDNVTVYIVTGIENNILVLARVTGCIPSGVPVLLIFNNEEIKSFTVHGTGDDPTIEGGASITANLLKVTDGTREFGVGEIYLYYKGEFLLNMPGTPKAGTIYIEANPASGARLRFSRRISLGIVGSQLFGSDYQWSDDRWFTIDGRRLNGKPTKKGLYILNGEKVVIK